MAKMDRTSALKDDRMTSESSRVETSSESLRPYQVYGTAVVFLLLGLTVGYFFRQSQNALTPAEPSLSSATLSTNNSPHAHHMLSLEEMKQVADKQANPLLEKLKNDPGNTSLLMQVGAIYHATHQFKTAAEFYGRAAQVDPKSVVAHTKYASSLYRSGDVDGAIAQLTEALQLDPKDANALFNLGMIQLQGKRNSKDAVKTWKKLLKSNPDLSPDRKAEVQKLIAQVASMQADQQGIAKEAKE